MRIETTRKLEESKKTGGFSSTRWNLTYLKMDTNRAVVVGILDDQVVSMDYTEAAAVGSKDQMVAEETEPVTEEEEEEEEI